MTHTTALGPVRSLVAKWRDKATGWDNRQFGGEGAIWLRACADELEAALSAPERVEVTDERVERAIIAGCATRPGEYPPNWPDDYSAAERAHGRAFMRAALTAAMRNEHE